MLNPAVCIWAVSFRRSPELKLSSVALNIPFLSWQLLSIEHSVDSIQRGWFEFRLLSCLCLYSFHCPTVSTSTRPPCQVAHRRCWSQRNLTMRTCYASCLFLSVSLMLPTCSSFKFSLQETYIGHDFFDEWNFETENDPTHGRTNYVDMQTARNTNLSFGLYARSVFQYVALIMLQLQNTSSSCNQTLRLTSNLLHGAETVFGSSQRQLMTIR